MRSKPVILQELFNTPSYDEALKLLRRRQDALLPLSSWSKLQIPYYASNHPILPSVGEIEQAMRTNKYPFSPVCRIGSFVVKEGSSGHVVQEAETLLYLRENSSVRVPSLYAVLKSQNSRGTVYYMVTEYIDGFTLSAEKFLSMPCATRAKLIASLSDQLRLLRSIPAPDYYGHVHKQGWRPCLYHLARNTFTTMCGPYETYDAFAQAAYDAAELSAVISYDAPDLDAEQVRDLSAFKSTLASCEGRVPRFTHLDVQLRNLIATPIGGTSEDDAQEWQVTLIDWMDAGWYPAFMQAVVLRERLNLYTGKALNREERVELVDSILKNLGEQSYVEVEKVFSSLIGSANHTLM